MKRVYVRAFLVTLTAAFALGSCSSGDNTATSTGSAAEQTVSGSETASADTSTDVPAVTEASETSEAVLSGLAPEEQRSVLTEHSIVQTGNTARLKRAFEKASAGEEITAAFIGGSITEGYTLRPEECWAKLTYDDLCGRFPDAKINYVNAGMSGTPSSLAVVRCERDVLAPVGDPDIVFVEFAVNDSQDSFCREAYESLVRRMLALDTQPAVILMFMRTNTGYSCQKQQSDIGFKYGLPMISLNDALSEAIDAGVMTWEDYSGDEAHPNPEGSKFIAGMTKYLFDCAENGKVIGDPDAPEITDVSSVEPLNGSAYENMHYLDRTTLTPVSLGEYNDRRRTVSQFPDGWVRLGGENEGIVFELEFDTLIMVYVTNKDSAYGTAEVYVDGEHVTDMVGYSSGGWNNPVPKLIVSGAGSGTHRVELKMAAGSEDDYFALGALGIS